MPTVSKQQEKTMRAAKHNKKFAKKVGIPQDVAKDFVAADKKAPKKNKPFRKVKKTAKQKMKEALEAIRLHDKQKLHESLPRPTFKEFLIQS